MSVNNSPVIYSLKPAPSAKDPQQNALLGRVDIHVSKTKVVELVFSPSTPQTPYLIQFAKDSQIIDHTVEVISPGQTRTSGKDELQMGQQHGLPGKVAQNLVIVLLDYQFDSQNKLLQVIKYIILPSSSSLMHLFNSLPHQECIEFSLKPLHTTIPHLLNASLSIPNPGGGMAVIKCVVLKKSRIKTSGNYFLLFCQLESSLNGPSSLYRVIVMVRAEQQDQLAALYFLLEQFDLDKEYYFTNLTASKFKLAANQTDFTRCLLFTISKSDFYDVDSCQIQSDTLSTYTHTLISSYTNYFSLVSPEDLDNDDQLVSYSGKITKVCNNGTLSFFEIDHHIHFHPLHILQNSPSLIMSLVAGTSVNLFNFHLDCESANMFPCCNSTIQIISFAPPSHGLLACLKLSKAMMNANFFDMLLLNKLLDKISALRKLVQTLQDGNTDALEIWRQKGDQVRATLSDASVLNSVMKSLGWTPLKVSKLEVLDHTECRVAVKRYSYNPICNLESLIAKILSASGGNAIGVSTIPLADSLFVLFHGVLPSGFGRLQDETASLLVTIKDSDGSTIDLFSLFTSPSFVFIAKGTLIVEKYALNVPPIVYLCVDAADIQVQSSRISPNLGVEIRLSKLETFYFYPNYKRLVRMGVERQGSKYLQSVLSGFLLVGSSHPIPAFIRFTSTDLRLFHACRLDQMYVIKIPTRCFVKTSNEYLVEWDPECRIKMAPSEYEKPPRFDSLLPQYSFVTVPHVLESALQYCSESSVVPLVNFSCLNVVSKSIESVRFVSKDYQQEVFSGDFNNLHNTVLLLASVGAPPAALLTVHVVDTCFPLLGICPGSVISLYGIRMEVRQGKVVGVAGVGSMLALEPLPTCPLVTSASSFEESKLTYLRNLFPSHQIKSFPQHSWVSVFPLRLFDLTLDLTCLLCCKIRYDLVCSFCKSKCVLNGSCNVLVHDSAMEFFAVIEGAGPILKLLDLEKEEQLVMDHLCLRTDPFSIYGNIVPSAAAVGVGAGDSRRKGAEWLERHCYSGEWKRRLNVQVTSLPSFLLHPPLFGNQDAPAVITNPNVLKVSSIKDLSSNHFLTLGLKWIKVQIASIRECEPVKEAFDLISEITASVS